MSEESNMDSTTTERQQAHLGWHAFNLSLHHRPEEKPSQPNVPLLRKTLEHIESHPKEWNQRHWAVQELQQGCGTQFCFAGWAITLAGDDVEWTHSFSSWPSQFSELCRTAEDGKLQAIAVRAAELLGLNATDADDLFRSSNNLEDLRTKCETLARRAGEQL